MTTESIIEFIEQAMNELHNQKDANRSLKTPFGEGAASEDDKIILRLAELRNLLRAAE